MNFLTIEGVETVTSSRVMLFYEYWLSRCEGDDIPRWSAIDLMDIYIFAPFIAVKDVVDNGAEFRNRYWGTELTNAYGYDATGKSFSDYLSPDAVAEGLAVHRSVMSTRKPLKSSGTLVFWKDKSHIAFEGLICPLKGKDDGVGHMISCYDFAGD